MLTQAISSSPFLCYLLFIKTNSLTEEKENTESVILTPFYHCSLSVCGSLSTRVPCNCTTRTEAPHSWSLLVLQRSLMTSSPSTPKQLSCSSFRILHSSCHFHREHSCPLFSDSDPMCPHFAGNANSFFNYPSQRQHKSKSCHMVGQEGGKLSTSETIYATCNSLTHSTRMCPKDTQTRQSHFQSWRVHPTLPLHLLGAKFPSNDLICKAQEA